MKTTNTITDKVQPQLDLESFYHFAKLGKLQQRAALAEGGSLLDVDTDRNLTVRLYLLKGFFVEETCNEHGVIIDIIPFKRGYKVVTCVEVKKKPVVKNSNLISYSISFVHRIAALLIVLFSATGMFSQANVKAKSDHLFGIGVDYFSSANGHGAFYSPQLLMESGKNIYSLGALIQKRSGIMNGLKLTYTRNLTGEGNSSVQGYYQEMPDLFQINAFGSLQYNNKLPLSYEVVKNETAICREQAIDLNNIQFATVEATAGFGLQVNITRSLSWKSYIGASVYRHINYLQGLDHTRMAAVITLGTGLTMLLH